MCISSAPVGRNNTYRHRQSRACRQLPLWATRAALAGLGIDRDRLRYRLPGNPCLARSRTHVRRYCVASLIDASSTKIRLSLEMLERCQFADQIASELFQRHRKIRLV